MTNYSDFDKVALQNNKNIKNPRSHSVISGWGRGEKE